MDTWTSRSNRAPYLSGLSHLPERTAARKRKGYQHDDDDDDDDGSASRAAPRERAPLAAQAAVPTVQTTEPDGAVGVLPDHHHLLLLYDRRPE